LKLSPPLAALGCALALILPVTPAAGEPHSGIDRTAFDPGVRAQDDFFLHVNGGWLKSTEFPADKSYIGVLETVNDRTQARLRVLIESAAQASAGDADARRVGDLYASFMDEARRETLGIAPLAEELKAIDAIGDRATLSAALARLARLGAEMPLASRVDQDDRDSTRYVPTLWQGGLGLPDRDYYLKVDDATFAGVRARYIDHLATLLRLAGERDSRGRAEAVLALETQIAAAQWTRVETRDPVKTYNLIAIPKLPEAVPSFDWSFWLAAAGFARPGLVVDAVPDVIVGQPDYVARLGELVRSAPLPAWKAYAKTRLLASYSLYLSKAFVDARFAFNGTALRGTLQDRPRWYRGVQLVDEALGESLGRVYVAAWFPPEHKTKMEALVGNLMKAYRQSIATLDWMGPETKQAAFAKLDRMSLKIGYPKRFRDYSALVILRDDLVGNVMRAREFEYRRGLAKLGKPVDRDEWGMNPQELNAYYNAGLNEIVFPAGVLQPPMFDPEADDAVNYGAIGAVIGHEISHAFDDSGSQYDAEGNLRVWWTPADRDRFEAKTKALVAQYAAFVPVPGYHLDGELTLGENIADNAGLEIAWKAYRLALGGKPAPVIDGMSGEQRFFYGFAQAWRAKQRPQALLEQIKSDPHSPEEFRVVGAVRNHSAFYATFGVKPGDAMYLPPEQRVSIW